MSEQYDKENPKYVLNEVCIARMKAIDTKIKYLFGTSLITIVLILIQILRG